jgi:hypothetical protein
MNGEPINTELPLMPEEFLKQQEELRAKREKTATFAGDSTINMERSLQDRIKANRKEYERLLKDDNYTDVKYDPNNGGLIATNKRHKKNSVRDETYFDGLTSIDLEEKCQNVLFRNGYSCIRERENIKDANGKLVSTLDTTTNGIPMDIKSATKNTINYRNMLDDKNNQLEKYNSRTDVVKSSSVILYFYDASFYDKQKVINGVSSFNKLLEGKNKTNHIKEIICVVDNGTVEHYYINNKAS